jgi:hypothetical protein
MLGGPEPGASKLRVGAVDARALVVIAIIGSGVFSCRRSSADWSVRWRPGPVAGAAGNGLVTLKR